MQGEDHVVKPETFIEWLNCNNKSILNTRMSWTSDYLWCDLGGVRSYYVNITKLMGFSHLIVRILHRMIIYSLNDRSINGHVSMQNMVLLKATKDGFQVNTTN